MSKTNKREMRIRVVGQRRKEPDGRRIAKVIIRLSLDSEAIEGRLADLDADTSARRKVQRANKQPLDQESA